MNKENNLLENYLCLAPAPLAIERLWECQLQSHLQFNRPVLDIGCGEGLFANILFDGPVDLGIDPNEKELERASQFRVYKELLACFGDQIPKESGSFQTIFSNSVMEHIPNIEDTLREAHRLLAVNGNMYLTLPTNNFEKYTCTYQILDRLGLDGLKKYYCRFFNQFWHHHHCYSSTGWEELFTKHSFKVKSSIEYGSKKQCMFNSFASPWCIVSYVVKKATNHWFLFPKLRKKIVKAIYLPIFGRLAQLKTQPDGKGGLIFFILEKA